MGHIDYLLIGHITRDLTPDGDMTGGTVTYSGRIGAALGYRTAVLTSCAADFQGLAALAGLDVTVVPSPVTTTFENVYTKDGRVQTIHAVATGLNLNHLPDDWQNPAIVHLAPLTDEVDPTFIGHFSHSLIGLTPQGWLRGWDKNGRVQPKEWAAAREWLPLADVVILSQEDLLNTNMLWRYWEWSKLLVLTGGLKGCIVIQGETAVQVPSIAVKEREATGAGDIFATAYLIRYHQTGDAIEAARFANFIAAHSVTQAGIEAVVEVVKTAAQDYEVKRKA